MFLSRVLGRGRGVNSQLPPWVSPGFSSPHLGPLRGYLLQEGLLDFFPGMVQEPPFACTAPHTWSFGGAHPIIWP